MKKKLRKNNFMRNKRSFIFITILCMGIGFAFLTSNLTINGNTSVSGNSWNIYFTNVQVNEESIEATVIPSTTGTTTTSLDYTVTFDKPGDFYEFTVDAVNNGTIDAMIQSVNMTSLDADVAKFVSYTATYLDGTPLAQNDTLRKNKTVTYKVRVEFKKNISAEDLDAEDVNLTLTFGVNYVQAPELIESKFATLVKDSALSDSSINFGTSNGSGLYVMNSTIEDDYPIYYYRGNVKKNNAKFAGFCWKIVRTTETGGTKLIYNGTPNDSGQCVNTTGDATQLTSTVRFNPNTSPAHNGYMYGAVYEFQAGSPNASHVYGNTFTYENGTYTLSDTHEGVDATHHYTCFSSGTTCASVKYVYYASSSTLRYITLTGGKDINTALIDMQTNTNNSTIKTAVDNWFNNTFKTYFTTNSKDYNNYLEDTVWCNDRSVSSYGGWDPNGGSLSVFLRYSPFSRVNAGTPSLSCPNKNDSFTVTESTSGNGALIYPVGLLTVDEIILAGGVKAKANSNFYLYTHNVWWSMTSQAFDNYAACEYFLDYDGRLSNSADIYGSRGVRPSISLKPGVKIAEGGDGSSATPYEFLVD